jgi:tetratricopeptide (TPR) repeat protein
MKLNKAQHLWYLLNRFDREESEALNMLINDQEMFPYFYLLNWNFNQGKTALRKTALCSPIRSQFYQVNFDAPEISKVSKIKDNQVDIIDDFLQNLPSIPKLAKSIPLDENNPNEDLSKVNWLPPVSETFAIILVRQQKYQQAIDIYEQLILAKPEKRLYFATRISDLKQIINE